MSQNIFPHQGQNSNLDPELIRLLLNYQQQQLQLEEKQLMYEDKRLQQDGYITEKSMDINSQLLKDAPAQHRKTLITYAVIGVIVFLFLLSFITYWIVAGKEDFVKNFLNWFNHFVTTALGFWMGRLTVKSNKRGNRRIEEIAEAELVD